MNPGHSRDYQRGKQAWVWIFAGLALFFLAAAPLTAAKIYGNQALGLQAWQDGRPCTSLVCSLSDAPLGLKKSFDLLGGDLEGDDEEEGEDSTPA
jgi:hypothetical protein